MKRIFSASLLLSLLLMMTTAAHSQTIAAASCNQSDVQTALNSVTSSTTLVTIPGGTCSWTSELAWAVPAGNTSLTIQGGTAISFTGTPGASNYACSINDGTASICSNSGSGATVIQDNCSSAGGCSNDLLNITLSGASSHFTLKGLTFEGGSSGTAKNNGIFVINGPSNNFRITQVHIDTATYPFEGETGSRFYGQLEGVIDHSVLDLGGNSTSNGLIMSNTIGDSIGYGDGTWAASSGFGGSAFMFIEDSIMNGGLLEDCDTAGRFVARYNSILNGSSLSSQIHTHGTKSGSGRIRSCRAYEAYHNYIQGPSSNDNAAVGSGGGPSLVWGNTVGGGYNNFGDIAAPRGDTETNSPTPGSWGYCGTTVNGNGVGSPWDGNTNTGTGYPCLDGLGRGQTLQALNGQNFPNVLDSILDIISWPQQLLEPIYYFDNSLGGVNEMVIGDLSTQLNRDVYIDNPNFNGTSGTGTGLLANRPSTCTAGPGGTYGTSPTGSYGVAYFATDANSGQGELYACTATNTWTGIYEPYTYPHPLESGSTAAMTPPAPLNLSGTLIQ